MKISFVCGKTFYMEDGEVAFKYRKVYAFVPQSGGEFLTEDDEQGDIHTLSMADMFNKAMMIPLAAIVENKHNRGGDED